ncbi:hypothetical protein [Flavobacterium orientale]|uniref:Lipoprotein n=1 Tax=Flavobacterium orientale TaxID=1756020 RepID=A0A917DGQ2_9FLAO|nr:hypothetical protein [Flavobacterium orientale]GGD34160.1 hypothetical protein GCM10011343_25120 [Flavobacterium orientale]
MKNLAILFFALLLISCKEPLVQFSEVQPENFKNLNSFPKKMIGNYYDSENEIDLEISKYMIVKKSILKDTFNVKGLSEVEILKGDTLVNTRTFEKTFVKKINDTLFTNILFKDTIFSINNDNILRKMKGYYFLNTKYSDNNWVVKKLFLKNGLLNMNDISTTEEIQMLEEIMETKKDTALAFVIKPTKNQFREFVKKNGFSNGEMYIKI